MRRIKFLPPRTQSALRRTAVILLVSSALALASLVSAVGTSAAADWPMFLQNQGRTSSTTDPNLSTANASLLSLKWASPTGGAIASSASVVGTTAYVGSWDGYEYAINTATGVQIWKQYLGQTDDPPCWPTPVGITSAPLVTNGTLYVGGGDAYWYALNASTGAVLWKVFTGDNSVAGAHYNWSSPLIVNGFAYIGIASNCDAPLVQGQLLKVNLATHQIVGTHNFVPDGQVGGGVWTTPTYDAATNTIFVSTGTINLYTQTESQAIIALDAATLATKDRWQLPFEAAVFDSDWSTTPTLTTDAGGDQLLSVANKNGILYTFARNNLAAGPIWQRRIAIGGGNPSGGEGIIASGAYNNNVLYYGGGFANWNGVGSGGSISAIDTATGNVRWTHQTDSPVFGSPAYVSGMVALTQGQTFEVLNAATGALLYSYQLGGAGPSFGAVSVASGQFYVGGFDGKLYAFGPGASPGSPPSDPNCPSGFACRDIANPKAGKESTSAGVLTVTGGGTGLAGASDQFRLVSKTVTGDSQSSVRITAQSTQNQLPDAGLVVRQAYGTSTLPGAPFFAVLAHPNDLVDGQPQPFVTVSYRAAFGQPTVQLAKVYPANRPVSVMIQRKGNNFSAGISSNGTTFQLIPGGSVGLDLPATTVQGLAVASGSATNTGTASFTNLAIGGTPSVTMAPPAPAHACPSTWKCTDIGNPSPPGDTTGSGTSIALAGTGTGFGESSDSVHYVYRSVSGDLALSTQVVAPTTASTAQIGLMMRASTAPTAPMYSVYLTPGGGGTVRWRVNDGVPDSAQVPLPTLQSPAYVQIVRFRDTRLNPPVTFFSTLTSTDGITWTPVDGSTVAINMGSGAYLAGLAATTGTPGVTTPATFNAISSTVPNTPPPGICPEDFTCADLGAANSVNGSQVYLDGTWRMDAAGADIWDTFDSFRFAWQPFPLDPANSANGDGTVSARVVSQTNPAGPWMKSGVMIRAGTGGGAPYYGVFVTPSHGVVVQWRTAQGALTSAVGAPAVSAPLWVLASRYTDTAHNVVYYSASTSTDGVHFTLVPGSTVALNLPGPLIAGIASDSYSAAAIATATFDNVAQLPGSAAPAGICPIAWSCADVGGALPAGQDQLAGGVWTESAGGGDIWDVADQFHYVTQTLNADGSVSARVKTQQNTDPWAKAGVMLRATADPGSPYYAAFVTPANGIVVQWRPTAGAPTSSLNIPGAVPAYLRVVRYTAAGVTSLTAYGSSDGTTWTAIPNSTITLNLSGPLLAGFAITSHAQGVAAAVTLDSVAITAESIPPPSAAGCPTGWSCADVGGALPAGSQTLTSGTWTLQAGGGDIWDVADQFRYVSKSLTADGTISAQVSSQTNTDPWAKAGVMVRATADPGSPYYAIFVTPANGIVVQWRPTAGAPTSSLNIPGATPAYLRITRVGTTFSAATSPDGSTWTTVAGSSTPLPNLGGALSAGLAATSHNVGALSTVVLQAVVTTP
jgi:outer membrane protein assembly factor BamB